MSPANNKSVVESPFSRPVDEIMADLGVSAEDGLSSGGVDDKRAQYGRNQLRRHKKRSAWLILIDQFKSLVIGLLAAAAVISLVTGRWIEAIAIGGAILANTIIGFVTELRAVRSMDALRRMSRTSARVRRDGKLREIASLDVVVGDVVMLEGGDLAPADIRLFEASRLQVDESALTGESVPVAKQTEEIGADTELAERNNMVFKGTALTRGSGEGVVVAVGRQTELGNIAEMVEEAEEERTPLEKRLDRLAHSLIWAVLGLAVLVGVLGFLRGKDLVLMIESAIALAVAAIPEGLPIVATVALARGMIRMARRNALVNRLASVQTLGATSVIGVDKTGTLTENKMTVTDLELGSGSYELSSNEEKEHGFRREGKEVAVDEEPVLHRTLRVGVLCNNASLSDDGESDRDGSGDPLEVALLEAGKVGGFERDELINQLPEEREEAFDSETKMMGTFHKQSKGGYLVAVKGAPEAVLNACTNVATGEDSTDDLSESTRDDWLERNDRMAAEGLRVLAIAEKRAESTDVEPYQQLTLLGLVGLKDPPRDDVPAAIKRCHQAGIRVVMMTGDQAPTARSIAAAVGLTDDNDAQVIVGRDIGSADDLSEREQKEFVKATVFARVSPRQKLDLIDIHQKQGSIVAMTGDGVNDAPALKSADIGVAMGKRGTQVAKEAADMVLRDDAFPTIVTAIRQGRAIFNNIRKFAIFLLSGNVAEIMAVGAASLAMAPLPLRPLQILFLNLVLDVFPALALGIGEGEQNIMKKPPRSASEAILAGRHWGAVALYGALIAAPVLGALAYGLQVMGLQTTEAVTISFLALASARLWHVFNMRDETSPVLRNEITRNRYVWIAIGFCAALIVGAVYVPGLNRVLELTPPSFYGWGVAIVAGLIPLLAGQILKSVGLIRSA